MLLFFSFITPTAPELQSSASYKSSHFFPRCVYNQFLPTWSYANTVLDFNPSLVEETR